MEQVARCNNLIGSKFLIPLFAFFSSPSSSYRVIAKRLKKIVLKNPTSPRYPSKEQALPEESRSFLSIQISRHPRFFHGKWRRKEKSGEKSARVEIYPEAAAAHARKESSACVRARVRVARFHCNPSCGRRRGPIRRGVPLQISMQL